MIYHLVFCLWWCIQNALIVAGSLHDACLNQNVEAVQNLLKDENFDVNAYDNEGYTALGRVVLQTPQTEALAEITTLLIKYPGIYVNLGNDNGESPLFLAASKNDYQMVGRLLEIEKIDANLKASNKPYCTPLLMAIKNADDTDSNKRDKALQTIMILLKHANVNVNTSCERKIPLLEAIKYANMEVIRLILSKNVEDINAVDEDGNGAFHIVYHVIHKNNCLQDLLFAKGIDHNMVDADGITLLHLACESFAPEIEHILPQLMQFSIFSLNILNRNKDLALHFYLRAIIFDSTISDDLLRSIFAIFENRDDFTEYSAQDDHGNTILHLLITVFLHRSKLYEDPRHLLTKPILLDKFQDFDFNIQNKNGATILHVLMCAPLSISTMRLVTALPLSDNIDLNSVDRDGLTALQRAAKNGNVPKLLYAVQNENLAGRMLQHLEEETPEQKYSRRGYLQDAIFKGLTKVVKMFLNDGKFGYSKEFIRGSLVFLERAVESGNIECFRMIWAVYEDSIKIDAGDSLLKNVLDSGIQEIYDAFEEKGCQMGGADGNSKAHWAVKYGWIDYLMENRKSIKVNAVNGKGLTLFHMALLLKDERMRSQMIDLLLEEPKLINFCQLLVDVEIDKTLLWTNMSHKLVNEVLQCYASKQDDFPDKATLIADIDAFVLAAYNNSSELFDKVRVLYKSNLFNDREDIFQRSSAKRLEAFHEKVIGRVSEFNMINITVDRNKLLASAKAGMRRIESIGEPLSTSRLNVKFGGERGVDGGALSREFLNLVSEELFKQSELFEMAGDYDKYVNVKPLEQGMVSEEMLEEYRFAGKILGLTLLNRSLLNEPIAQVLLRRLLDLPETWKDIKETSLSMFDYFNNSYINMTKEQFLKKKYKIGDIDRDLDENDESYDQPLLYEECEAYVAKNISSFITKDRALQAAAMKEGLNSIIPEGKLAILRPAELQELLSGTKDIDLADWREHTDYKGEYKEYRDNNNGADHPTIEFFWRFMRENPDYQLKMLQFATAYSRVPSGGFGNLRVRFTIRASNRIEYESGADTCFSLLILPTYQNYEILSLSMKRTVDSGTTFTKV